MSKSRIGCQNCRRKYFLSLADSETQLKHFARARTYAKYAFNIEEKILKAIRVSTLHSCSPECTSDIKLLRLGFKRIRKEEVKKKKIMLKSAMSLHEMAQFKYSESMLLNGPDSDVTIRNKIKLDHYAALVGQRLRRLNEYQQNNDKSST